MNAKTRDTLLAIALIVAMFVVIGMIGQCMGPEDLGVASPN